MMKILIYGAGVIGCLYGALFSETDNQVVIYARGNRLNCLQEKGLLYLREGKIKRANVQITAKPEEMGKYDLILLAVKGNQVRQALEELKGDMGDTILTMVNTTDTYEEWESICGKGRIIPGFPGAGGGWKDDILEASLTPKWVQATTLGEAGNDKKEIIKKIENLFREAGIPYKKTTDMHTWQLCHLALVVPLADVYYNTSDPAKAYADKKAMKDAAISLKNNFKMLKKCGLKITPTKFKITPYVPTIILRKLLQNVYKSKFAETFMYRHSIKAPDEMRDLHEQFYNYIAILEKQKN